LPVPKKSFALIAAMLLTRITGKRPSKRQMEMLQFYILGQCSLKELEAVLALKKARK
jgi:hypothetical protein